MARKRERKKFSIGTDKPAVQNQAAKLDPDDPKLKAFAKGAKTRTVEADAGTDLDPKAKPNKTLTLRLNDYQLELLRRVSEQESRSIQKTLVWHLVPLLEARLESEAKSE